MSADHAIYLKRQADGKWQLLAADLGSFANQFGRDLLAAFSVCFVQVDRVASLGYFMHLANLTWPVDSIARRRQFATFFLFSAGTLRELASALPKLRGLLRKAAPPIAWPPELQAVEDLWEKVSLSRVLRNKLAFHVDPTIMSDGLGRLSTKGPQAILEGDSKMPTDIWCGIGVRALFEASGFDDRQLGQLADQHLSQLEEIPRVLNSLFVEAVQQRGIEISILESSAV